MAGLKNPIADDPGARQLGLKLYADRCADCHGKKGHGDGANAADLEVKPGDLSKPAIWKQSDGELFWKISEGRRPMPAYGKKLSDKERWAVVSYVRTLAPKPKLSRGPG